MPDYDDQPAEFKRYEEVWMSTVSNVLGRDHSTTAKEAISAADDVLSAFKERESHGTFANNNEE